MLGGVGDFFSLVIDLAISQKQIQLAKPTVWPGPPEPSVAAAKGKGSFINVYEEAEFVDVETDLDG